MNNHKEELILSKFESWKMFDEISPRYDELNQLLSLGWHHHWRRCLVSFLPAREHMTVLDLATGTADVLLTLFSKSSSLDSGVGLDMSEKMLKVGGEKLIQNNLENKIELRRGDIKDIPYKDNTFDVVTIAFGIRNVDDPLKALKEMYRVLTKRGRVLVLEFSLPENSLLRAGHLFYLRHVVPLLGGWISGHAQAYRYLNQTIEAFPYGENFCDLLDEAGFTIVRANPLMGGIATIYQGDKL